MGKRIWYEIWIRLDDGSEEMVIRVKSPGLANWLILKLGEIYDEVFTR